MPARSHGFGSFRKRTQAYRAWLNMRSRCNNPRNPDYKYYGGRGVGVCAQWNDFAAFLQDMGDPPPAHTLDRIDGRFGYAPGNCRWATRKTQARNRAYCKLDPTKAEEIRRRYRNGERQVDLAAEFHVTQPAISRVTRGAGWI